MHDSLRDGADLVSLVVSESPCMQVCARSRQWQVCCHTAMASLPLACLLYTEWMQTLCRCALPSVAIPALANDHIEACDMTPQMSLAKSCACTTCAT